MLFLLNDVVFSLDSAAVASAMDVRRMGALRLTFVSKLGQEVFAEEPLLHRVNSVRARRLASLIMAKAPEINAGLFLAPSKGCPPDQVTFRYATVDFPVMAGLMAMQQEGELSTLHADRQVWKRLAA